MPMKFEIAFKELRNWSEERRILRICFNLIESLLFSCVFDGWTVSLQINCEICLRNIHELTYVIPDNDSLTTKKTDMR